MLSHCLRRADSADRTFHFIPLLGLILLLAAPVAGADEPGPEEAAEPAPPTAVVAPDDAGEPPPAHQVGPVTVTATRAERDVLEVPGNVTVIDREDIERSGVRTVPELLRRESGIFVTTTTTSPVGVQVEARGFNNGGALGSSMLVQINGRRANEADTGNTDWALIALDEIESIEIVRGPASALYGDNAVGGVVNIRTRPGEGPPRATLRGRLASYDTGQGSLKAAGSFGAVTGSLFVDGLATDAYRHGADFSSVDVNGSLQSSLGERVIVGVSGGRYWDDRGLPGALTRKQIDELGRRAQDPNSGGNRSDVQSRFVSGWIEAVLADQVELKIRPFYRWRDDATRITSLSTGLNLMDTAKSSVGVDVQTQVDRQLLAHPNRVVAGFEFLSEDVERTLTATSPDSTFESLTSGERRIYSGYLQEEFNVTETLLASAGVRFDRACLDLSLNSRFEAPPFPPSVIVTSDDPCFSVWSPKAALTYRVLPPLAVYVSYARGFRLPNVDEDVPQIPSAPPDLDPQISDSIELGAKYEGRRWQALLALYHMWVHNEITFALGDPSDVSDFGNNANFDLVRHRGIELSFAVQILEWLVTHASYTLEDVEIREFDPMPEFEGRRMPMTPKHRGSVGLFAQLPHSIEFAANLNVVGSRILSNDFPGDFDELDPYATLDFLLAWRPRLGEHVEGALSFGLYNATGEKYDGFGARYDQIDFAAGTKTPIAVFNPAPTRTWEVGFALTLRR